ncbi:MAG: hypothetical protein DLM70_12775 [Chloroflexi bacterium]|nr:MAG: hypothetical protein DLM70_12775 [Chloroflexota bacterium]
MISRKCAALYRLCRSQVETLRRLNDCLIAVVAIRAEIGVLHRGRDFDAPAQHSSLLVVPKA